MKQEYCKQANACEKVDKAYMRMLKGLAPGEGYGAIASLYEDVSSSPPPDIEEIIFRRFQAFIVP